MVKERIANFGIFLDVFEFLRFGCFFPFFQKNGFWGILGPPSYGIGALAHWSRDALSPVCGIFHYCFKKNEKNKKKKKKNLKHPTTRKASSLTPIWKPLGQGNSLHWHPLKPPLTHGCPLTPLNLLKVPTKTLGFRNVSKASSVTPIWKPLGQGSSLAHLRTTFDTWLPPGPPKPT